MHIGRLSFLTTLIVLFPMMGPAAASNWPRFRGPNGTGIAPDKDIPVKWTEEEGLAWKVGLKGVGHSSPVVWGNHVFLQSASGDGKERFLLCYNVVDGKLLWSQSVAAGRGKTHSKNSLASSTPATDGERVYAFFWDGSEVSLHAYDFKGKHVWERSLGRFRSQHGPGTSPIVCSGKVIVNNDQDGAATLVALDAKTGKPAWEARRKAFRTSYSTPFVLDRPGGEAELIAASTAGITGYDPQTGLERWSWTWRHGRNSLRTVSSPIFHQGMIFANSGDGSGARHTVAIKLDRGETIKPSVAWETEKSEAPYVPGMLAWGNDVYFVNDQGLAGCYEARSGKLVWSQRLGSKVTASPILIDGKVYAVTERGDVHIFQAAATFKLLAKNSLGESVSATPAVADNRLFIRGETHLYCIANRRGER